MVFSGYSSNDNTQTLAENSGRRTTTLVSTASTVVPGSNTKFTGFSDTATAQGGTVFYGEGSTDATRGIFVSSPSSNLQTVTTLKSFTTVDYPAIDKSGAVVFTGTQRSSKGLWYTPQPTQAPVLIVSAEQLMPGAPGTAGGRFTCIESTAISGQAVAFFGSTCDGSSSDGRDRDRMFGTVRSADHCLKNLGSANLADGIFLARLSSSPGGKPQVEVVASTIGTPVPGATQAGETFEDFSSAEVGEDLVVFVASTSAGTMGVYAYTMSTRALGLVANTNTPVSGGNDTFTGFPQTPSVHETSVAFYASAGGSASGIYLRTPSGTQVEAVVTQASKINGEAISFIGFGGNAFDGETVAFYAVTSTNGIYTASVGQAIKNGNNFTVSKA